VSVAARKTDLQNLDLTPARRLYPQGDLRNIVPLAPCYQTHYAAGVWLDDSSTIFFEKKLSYKSRFRDETLFSLRFALNVAIVSVEKLISRTEEIF